VTLSATLKEMIQLHGPLTVADFMQACLHHPEHGYYATRPALGGENADFLTAPEASQMFGELIGLWCAHEWTQIGTPHLVHLIELGPGRGVLMQDALRAARKVPDFTKAIHVNFVEASAPLRAQQATRVADAHWMDRLADVSPGHSLILGNEFLDCLPIRQFVDTPEGRREKLVGLDDKGELAFGLSAPLPGTSSAQGVIEIASGLPAFIQTLADRLHAHPGRALFLDYGYETPKDAKPWGADTLQAVKAHKKIDSLACPGEADLTAHVDFSAVKKLAALAGLTVAGPVFQGQFLRTLGLDQRAAALARAHPGRAKRIDREHARLTHADQMGVLFKAICLSSPNLPPPAGF
jgi:NADH dehydrogenase [ubiquinone] 1 alpha subcomplex assembly factor 7